jgi:surface protein
VYIGNGQNEFTEIQTGIIGLRSSCIDIGDANGDSLPDILIAGYAIGGPIGPTTALYYGDGSGGFSRSSANLVGVGDLGETTSCDIGNLDDDLRPDLLVSGKDDNSTPTTTIYFGDGNGSGSFSRRNTSLLGVSDGENAIGDFNDDGHTDIILNGRAPDAEFGYATALHVGDGTGNFQLVLSGLFGSYTGSVSTSDLIGDERPEVLVTGSNDVLGRPVAVLHSQTNTSELEDLFNELETGFTGARLSSSAFGNFAGTSFKDVVVAGNLNGETTTSVYQWVGPSGDNLVEYQEIHSGIRGMIRGSISAGDFDGDGDTDILLIGDEGGGEDAFIDTPFVRLYVNRAEQSGANRAPQVIQNPRSNRIVIGESVDQEIEFGDPDGDHLTIRLTEGAGVDGAILSDMGDGRALFSYTPDQEQAGSVVSFTVEVSDGRGGVISLPFNVDVRTNEEAAFVTTWETTSAQESITIPTRGGFGVTDYDFQIDWGDGTVEQITGDDPDPSHVYAEAGVYTVSIAGTFPRIFLNDPNSNNPNTDKLRSIEQWGAIQWITMESAFAGARGMVYNATDTPDLSQVTDLSSMFWSAEAFNGEIGDWNVSRVTNMANMFVGAAAFDQDISAWDVSRVINMGGMFYRAETFNQNINTWNVSGVTNMQSMFRDATSFNQPIGAWDVSRVTDMAAMFSGATIFNQPIGNWDVSSVTDMGSMFREATAFDQDLDGWNSTNVTDTSFMFYGAEDFNQKLTAWDVSKVTNMRNMFDGASSFNQDISGWDVSSVTSMRRMFSRATAFNQDLSNWDVSNVTDMGGMFFVARSFDGGLSGWDVSSVTDMGGMFSNAVSFNQDLGSWDVSSVTDMSALFVGCASFNQDLSTWNVSSVTDMSFMFNGASNFNRDISEWDVFSVTNMRGMFVTASSFNQDIGGWDVSSVTDMVAMFFQATDFDQDLSAWDVTGVNDSNTGIDSFESFLQGASLSPANYDALLMGWSQLDLADGLTFDAGQSRYTEAGEAARQDLIDTQGWSITDLGPVADVNATQMVDTDGTFNFGATGVTIDFSNVTGSGAVTVQRFEESPTGINGIQESNVSTYRLVIDAAGNLGFGPDTEVRFELNTLDGITDPSSVEIYRRPVEATGDFVLLSTRVDDNSTPGDPSDDNLVAETDSFSEFVFASNDAGNPLPVELADFSATISGDQAVLRWQTTSETGNVGFDVERRTGNDTWTRLRRIAGAGTTSEPQSYRFRDTSVPFAADSLTYRLRQIDVDGTSTFFDEITLARPAVTDLALLGTFPNPARGRTTIRFALPQEAADSKAVLQLYDVLGRRVRQVNISGVSGRSVRQLDVSGLAGGTYFVRLVAGGEARVQQLSVIR